MRALAPIAVALTLLAGCGESDEQKVERVVRGFVEARVDGDGQRACDLMDPALHAGYAEESPKGVEPSCAEGFRRLVSQPGVTPPSYRELMNNSTFKVFIKEDTAEVRAVPLGRYWLRRIDGSWRITDWE